MKQFFDEPVEERYLFNFAAELVSLQPTTLNIMDDPIPSNILPTPLSLSSPLTDLIPQTSLPHWCLVAP